MKIILDENNYIVGYCEIGDSENSIEVDYSPDIFTKPMNYYKYKNGEIILDIDKIRQDNKKKIIELKIEKKKQQIKELEDWFEYYDLQVNQYNRCIRLNESFDLDIDELDEQAKTNQLLIRQLKEEIRGV